MWFNAIIISILSLLIQFPSFAQSKDCGAEEFYRKNICSNENNKAYKMKHQLRKREATCQISDGRVRITIAFSVERAWF